MIKAISFFNDQGIELKGDLFLPEASPPFPCVVFAHGLYSSCKSPRNREIAFALLEKGIASLLFDFSERERFKEETWLKHKNDLKKALDFLQELKEINLEKIGVNGSSTGATAALNLASQDRRIKTVVVRSARVLGIWEKIDKIKVPVLIIIGELDPIKEESKKLYKELKTEKKMIEIFGAGHLFEEGETFKELLKITVNWYDGKFKK